MAKVKDILKGMVEVYCQEFNLVLRDAGIVLFFTFLPILYPIIYSLIYNPELVKDVPMVVVDNDRTPRSRELVRRLDACDQVWVKGYAANLPEARRAVDSKEAFSILEIPEGFEEKIGRGETSPAVIYSDMTLLLRYRGTLVAATNVMQEMGGEILTEKVNRIAPLAGTITAGEDLLPIHNVYMGNTQGGFDTFIMPAVLILIIHQCIILMVGMAGGAKRENPRLVGNNPAVILRSTFANMLAQMLCYLTLMILPIIFIIHYVPLIFNFPMNGNFWDELAFLTPMFLGCLAIGFVFQALVREREAVFVSWVVTSVFFLLISGVVWPYYDMPPVWQAISSICPSTWGVQGFIRMETTGATLAQVRGAYLNLWVLVVIWWAIAWACQKYFVRPTIARSAEEIAAREAELAAANAELSAENTEEK
jgi:ABC-2 type transport system permease protein